MAVNIGPKIGIDGEAEYRKQINNIIQQAKTLDSEMKAVTSAFTSSTSAQEKQEKVFGVLTKQIANQANRVEELSKMLEASKDKFGENATQTLKWQQAVNEATAELNGLRGQSDNLDAIADGMEEAGNKALSFGEIIKAHVTADFIISGIKALASAVKDMAGDWVEAAASVNAVNAQFEQTFGNLAPTATANIDEISRAAGILPERLRESYSQFYAYAMSTGMDSVQALEFATDATYAAADAAAYYDRSLEETTEQVMAYTKGNFANDAALGFASTEATRNAAALASLGKEYSELDVTAGETTRVLLDQIIAAQEASNAIGQASRESSSWANVQGNLTSATELLNARIGQGILAVLTPFAGGMATLIRSLALGEVGVRDFVSGVVENIGNIGDQINESLPQMFEMGGEILTALLEGFVALAPKIVESVITLITQFQTFIYDNLPTIIDLGVQLLVSLVNGFVEALPRLIEQIPIMIGSLAAGIIENLPTIIDAGLEIIPALVIGFVTTIPLLIEQIPELFKMAWDAFKEQDWLQIGKDIINGIINGLVSMGRALWDAIVNIAKEAMNAVKDFFGINSPSTLMRDEIGKMLPAGIAVGFDSGMPKAIRSMTSSLSSVGDIASGVGFNVGTIQRPSASIVIENITFQNYTSAQGRALVNDLNRQLGRLYA